MRVPKSVKSLEELGRVRLSDSFFMRDFLYSEISQIEGIPNIPEDPDAAIQVGTKLCELVLEPIQESLGRISIRSGYRSPRVNAKGAENKNQYNCSSNQATAGRHIWDRPDSQGNLGATACVVVNSFVPYYERTGNWRALAWWVHDNVPHYSSMYFFPKLAAFNIRWCSVPEKTIRSYIPPKGCLTDPAMANSCNNHAQDYREYLATLGR
ncbi:MAG: peptidase M15 [Pseudohongiellaceae bacterium]